MSTSSKPQRPIQPQCQRLHFTYIGCHALKAIEIQIKMFKMHLQQRKMSKDEQYINRVTFLLDSLVRRLHTPIPFSQMHRAVICQRKP